MRVWAVASMGMVSLALLAPGTMPLGGADTGGPSALEADHRVALDADVPAALDADPPAAAVTFAGTVTDAASGRPVAGARVMLEGSSHGVLTRADGTYSLAVDEPALVDREVTLAVRALGYEEARKSVVAAAGTVRVDFSLARATLELEAVVVGQNVRIRGAALDAAAAIAPSTFESGARQELPGRYNPDFHTESYARIEENRWLAPSRDPLSTFSIDVDRASYANIRRFITQGVRPPVDAVRIEEMVNYFPYDYPDARGEHPFVVTTEVAPAPWRPVHRLVRIGIQGRKVDMASAPPSNLVFLLDVSGSMRPANKLPLLKRSLRMLVDELRPRDRVAIVVYAGAAGLVLESTPGSEKGRILEALERLEAGGSTAGGAGIRLAYEMAARNRIEGGNNRVILATDGDFNIGASSDAEMIRLIEDKRREGVFLTVLGFGTGNLKDSKMEGLADHGNGTYAYIDSPLEARKVLVGEMGGTLFAIAKDVKIQVEFNPARVQAYRLIGYENRLLAAEDFNDDAKDAGELGAGHSVTALYEVVPAGAPPVETGSVDPLRYGRADDGDDEAARDAAERAGTEPDAAGPESSGRPALGPESRELLFVKLRYKRPDGERSRLTERPVLDRAGDPSTDLRFAAAVAAFGMLLRDSEQGGDFTLEDVSRLARGALGDDPEGYRAGFVRLVEATRELGLLEQRHAAAGG